MRGGGGCFGNSRPGSSPWLGPGLEGVLSELVMRSPSQFHITLAVGSTAPSNTELMNSISPGPVRPAGREANIPQVHASERAEKLEPKRQGMFNPPFKYTQTCELNNSERLEGAVGMTAKV